MKRLVLVAMCAACGPAPAVAPPRPPIANSADDAARSVDAPVDLVGEWIDEVGTLFVFEPDGAGGVTLVRAALQRGDGDELTDLATGTDAQGRFWLRYAPSSETTVTITVTDWVDGHAMCTWDNGESAGEGFLYRADDPALPATRDDEGDDPP